MRKAYPSDITREQFEVIRYILESSKKVTHPKDYELYDIFCAVLYVLKEGCTWRALPHDYPPWQNVYYHFRSWKEQKHGKISILDEVLEELVISERIINGRNPKTSMIIVDSKSIKNTDTAEEKGYDGGKKISGIKTHLAVDTNGLPHGINVTTANVTDRDGAIEMIQNCAPNLSDVAKVLCDGGYTGENFANAVEALIDAEVEVVKRNELHKFVVIPKRWVVERSNAWLEKFRRLWKNCERKIHTSLQMTRLNL
jgi:transposase